MHVQTTKHFTCDENFNHIRRSQSNKQPTKQRTKKLSELLFQKDTTLIFSFNLFSVKIMRRNF